MKKFVKILSLFFIAFLFSYEIFSLFLIRHYKSPWEAPQPFLAKVWWEAGLPHIEAQDQKSYQYALGYLMGTHRLFQIDLLRRFGRGDLAGLVGDSVGEQDKVFQRLKMGETLLQNRQRLKSKYSSLKNLDEEMQAFYHGLNSARRSWRLAWEYWLLGKKPLEFVAGDSESIMGLVSLGFNNAWKYEKWLGKWRAEWPAAKFRDYFGFEAKKNLSLSFPSFKFETPLEIPQLLGSNAYFLQSSFQQKLYLANDPHIDFQFPGFWFSVAVKIQDEKFHGHYLPGIPYPLIAHTDQHAWSLTIGHGDDMDWFYKVPADLTGREGWERPLLLPTKKSPSLGIIWSFYHPENLPFLALRGMLKTRSSTDWEEQVTHLKSPSLNSITAFAKEAGAHYFLGKHLIEGSFFPRTWEGKAPRFQSEAFFVTRNKYLVSANHRNSWLPIWLQGHFDKPWRFQRLQKRLDELSQKMSFSWQEWQKLAFTRGMPNQNFWVEQLKHADSSYPQEFTEQIIYGWRVLLRRTIMQAAGVEWGTEEQKKLCRYNGTQGFLQRIWDQPESPWWQGRHEEWKQKTLKLAITEYGKWRPRKIHFKHAFSGAGLKALFSPSMKFLVGGRQQVNNMKHDLCDPSLEVMAGPSLRLNIQYRPYRFTFEHPLAIDQKLPLWPWKRLSSAFFRDSSEARKTVFQGGW